MKNKFKKNKNRMKTLNKLIKQKLNLKINLLIIIQTIEFIKEIIVIFIVMEMQNAMNITFQRINLKVKDLFYKV